MTKKTLFLSSIPIMALPAFVIVSCAGTTQSLEQQGQTELTKFAFLQVKFSLSQIAKSKPSSSTQFEEMINRITKPPLIKSSEFKVQIEGKNFVVNYKLVIYSGTFDQAFNNKDQIAKNETEELTGSLKFPILTNLQRKSNPSKLVTSDLSEVTETKPNLLI